MRRALFGIWTCRIDRIGAAMMANEMAP